MKKRLEKMVNELSHVQEDNIIIFNLGDNLETIIPDGMHYEQSRDMMSRGAEQMIDAVDHFSGILGTLAASGKKVKLVGINGNHDRMSKNADEDRQRTAGILFYEMVKRTLREYDNVEIEYVKEVVSTYKAGMFNFVLAHGDKGYGKKKAEQILQMYGDPVRRNIMLE
jgi:hypothetical protein